MIVDAKISTGAQVEATRWARVTKIISQASCNGVRMAKGSPCIADGELYPLQMQLALADGCMVVENFTALAFFSFLFRCLLRAFCVAWFSLYRFHRLIFETWVCWHQLDMPILVHHSQYQHLWSKHVKTEAFVWSSRHFFKMKIALIHPTPKVCQLLLHHSLHNRSGTRRRRGRRWRRFAVHLGGKQARRSWF